MSKIIFKNEKSAKSFYDLLVSRLPKNGENSIEEQQINCILESDAKSLVNDINNNPSHTLSHLKINVQTFTLRDLQSTLFIYEKLNVVDFDVYFDRTKTFVIELIFDMCLEFIDEILSVEDMRIAYERCICDEVKKLKYQSLHSISDETFVPVAIAPENRQISKKYKDKNLSILSYKPRAKVLINEEYKTCKVNFIFANVEEPKYVLEDLYTDDYFNPVFVNDQNEIYCLMPLLQIGKKTNNLLFWYHGKLNEHHVKTELSFYAMASLIYNIPLNIENFQDVNISIDEAKALLKHNYKIISKTNHSKLFVQSVKRNGIPVISNDFHFENTQILHIQFALAKIRQYNKKEVFKNLDIKHFVSQY